MHICEAVTNTYYFKEEVSVMKNMLNFKEFTADELMDILNLALDMKKNPEKYSESLKGKKLYTLFEKTSTRTFQLFFSANAKVTAS